MSRAQAAVEHLMSYGFAIVMVLVVLGALSYFGVLNVYDFVPEKCALSGFECEDFSLDLSSGKATLVLRNSASEAVYIKLLSVGLAGRNFLCRFVSPQQLRVGAGESVVVVSNCTRLDGSYLGDTGAFSGKRKYSLSVEYSRRPGSLLHEGVGDMLVNAQGSGNVSSDDVTGLLSGFWRLEGNATDYSGFHNDGVVAGAACGVQGWRGSGCGFDGVNDFIDVGNSPSLRFSQGFTVMAWFKRSNVVPSSYSIVSKGTPSNPPVDLAYSLFIDANDGVSLRVSDVGNGLNQFSAVSTPSGAVADTGWHHVAGVYTYNSAGNVNGMAVYLDGVQSGALVTNSRGPVFDSPSPVLIAAIPGPSWVFNGVIDEVKIVNRSLSAEEIRLIYDGEK
ncbi:LamG domain-containing protein [Candidatus Woesearchaeota archaeon]|nr:LamG domain-containing protein [Candidatus Woesearchaeota archaeon]